MPKTVPPGEIRIADGERFSTNVLPDPFDERDFEYRPRLQPLPPTLDQRVGRMLGRAQPAPENEYRTQRGAA